MSLPKCQCKKPAVKKTSVKHNGRKFVACATGKCRYFRWWESVCNEYDSDDGFVVLDSEDSESEWSEEEEFEDSSK